ncbi:hypothetical protein CYMTET_8312 [Cymbomonas tetramitiformis]|uniref:Cupin fold metalloprotein WbuC cupin domain-containing protein n=1 Tax=Cymbomonas tetramitiformis TaxID=36881 RepID=A0AAE0LG72_9CHLO|nr:hypothetical protein CYMTET_8312 [Cymbomonas tetramitiformis]
MRKLPHFRRLASRGRMPKIAALVCVFTSIAVVFVLSDPYKWWKSSEDKSLAPITTFTADQLVGLEPSIGVKEITVQHFDSMIKTAKATDRKRKMVDLTQDPARNDLQTMMNTWIEGSYSPVHLHREYAETFVVLHGALLFFTFDPDGSSPLCHILSPTGNARAIVVEKGEWHAMTAAPTSLGYPGEAIVFETSGHKFDLSVPTKVLATFAPSGPGGIEGDPNYFAAKLIPLCKTNA